jgi:hypothetical protein
MTGNGRLAAILGLLLLLAASGLGLAAAPGLHVVFPADQASDQAKFQWALRLQERLRRWNNAKVATLPVAEAQDWHREHFLPRSRALGAAILPLRRALYGPRTEQGTVLPWFAAKQAIRSRPDGHPDLAGVDLDAAFAGTPRFTQPPDPTEDLTTYTEQDVGANRITMTASTVTITDLDRDEEVYLYDDKGVSHFGAAWTFTWECRCTAASGNYPQFGMPGVSNTVDDYGGMFTNNYQSIVTRWLDHTADLGYHTIDVYENEADDEDYGQVSIDTPYWVQFERTGETTSQVRIYDSQAQGAGDVVDTLLCAVPSGRRYRYFFATSGWNTGAAGRAISGYVKDLDLHEYPILPRRFGWQWEWQMEIK